jgi:acetyl-CoA synthetase
VALITADGQMRGGKEIALEARRRRGAGDGGCEAIRTVIVYKRTGSNIAMKEGRDKWWHDVVRNQPMDCEPTPVNAEHPLFILYTSGSTGKPKGVQHSTGGYLLHAILTMKWVFDYKPTDVFWCTGRRGLGHGPYLHRVRPARCRARPR